MRGLERTWRTILFKGSQLLALTIPECHIKVPWLEEARDYVNEKTLNHKARNLWVPRSLYEPPSTLSLLSLLSLL